MAHCLKHGDWPLRYFACPKCFEDGDVSRPIRRTLTADEIRRLRVILRRSITPWMANSLCSLALKGLKK
jgi:hypothetical protein